MRRIRSHQPTSRRERPLVEGRSDERAGTQDPGDQEAGMDPVASSTGPAIVGDRSGAAALVMVVGGGFQHQATGAAPAQLAGPVLVVVLGGWPVRVLPAGGPLPTSWRMGSGWPWTTVACCWRRGTWPGAPVRGRPVVAAARPGRSSPRR